MNLVYVIGLAGIIYFIYVVYKEYSNNNHVSNYKSGYRYQNQCWKCKSKIDSNQQLRCPICGWYICDKCGKCGCDYEGYIR